MKVKELLTRSESISREYCATVVRIGEVHDIPGADKIGMTLVNGFSVVVSKSDTHTGDIMFYCANETMLDPDFLSINNQFEIGERQRNSNYKEVQGLLDQAETCEDQEEKENLKNQAKSMTGFFNKHGRVKMITLRKQSSYGYLVHIDAMSKYCPKILEIEDLESFVDDPNEDHDFDTVDGKEFIKVYIPPVKENGNLGGGGRSKKRQKKVDQFDRMIPGQFILHYDTQQLNREIGRINPTDVVTISVKMHGTSCIFGNVKTKVPHVFNLGFSWISKIFNKLYCLVIPASKRKYDIEYGNVYSSRTVIKNQYINNGVSQGFYGEDVWQVYNEMIKDYIPKDMTIYGEIIGFTPSGGYIQKGYDYGCSPNCGKLMIYRITTNLENGHKKEWDVKEVKEWVEKLIEEHPEIKDKMYIIPILYHGTLLDLYPNLDPTQHWHENVLEELKKEKRFGMEKDEPLCKNKVPREGFVLRIDGDPIAEAFKLKTDAFMKREKKLMDNGEVDMEMIQNGH